MTGGDSALVTTMPPPSSTIMYSCNGTKQPAPSPAGVKEHSSSAEQQQQQREDDASFVGKIGRRLYVCKYPGCTSSRPSKRFNCERHIWLMHVRHLSPEPASRDHNYNPDMYRPAVEKYVDRWDGPEPPPASSSNSSSSTCTLARRASVDSTTSAANSECTSCRLHRMNSEPSFGCGSEDRLRTLAEASAHIQHDEEARRASPPTNGSISAPASRPPSSMGWAAPVKQESQHYHHQQHQHHHHHHHHAPPVQRSNSYSMPSTAAPTRRASTGGATSASPAAASFPGKAPSWYPSSFGAPQWAPYPRHNALARTQSWYGGSSSTESIVGGHKVNPYAQGHGGAQAQLDSVLSHMHSRGPFALQPLERQAASHPPPPALGDAASMRAPSANLQRAASKGINALQRSMSHTASSLADLTICDKDDSAPQQTGDMWRPWASEVAVRPS